MGEQIGRLIGGLLGGALSIALVVAIFTSVFFWPFMLWSAVRNIRGIRQQLERLNDTLEHRGPERPGGVIGL